VAPASRRPIFEALDFGEPLCPRKRRRGTSLTCAGAI
jgi:hypothetical protein